MVGKEHVFSEMRSLFRNVIITEIYIISNNLKIILSVYSKSGFNAETSVLNGRGAIRVIAPMIFICVNLFYLFNHIVMYVIKIHTYITCLFYFITALILMTALCYILSLKCPLFF